MLFEEKLDLFVALLRSAKVTWEGRLRPPLKDQGIYPPIENPPLKAWIGVGGSPESVVRAAHYDLPLSLAIIGGDPKRFQPFVDLYKRAFAQLGQPVKDIAVHSPGHVADTDAQAREEYWVGYKGMHDRIGGERGWPPIGRAQFEQEVERGSLYVGAPETVARKIAATAKALGLRALRHEIQRRHAGARQDDAQHRALRQQGHAAGAGDAGVTDRPILVALNSIIK